mgnify:CR=1 FL=1
MVAAAASPSGFTKLRRLIDELRRVGFTGKPDSPRVVIFSERIATLGVSPVGTPGALVAERNWDDYSIGRSGAIEHLGALDKVYQGVITSHRNAAADTEKSDPVTNDLLIGHLHELELFQWFVRAHLEFSSGALSTEGVATEKGAARKASAQNE